MIVPPANLPPDSMPWADAVNQAQKETRETLSTLDEDIAARFSGLDLTMKTLGNQVSNLTEYASRLERVQVDFTTASSWSPTTSYSTFASLSIAVPAGYTQASVYVIGAGTLYDTANNMGASVWSRLSVGASVSQEMQAFVLGVVPSPQWWGLTTNFATNLYGVSGAINVTFDLRCGTVFGPVAGAGCTLACLTTFS